MSEPQNGGKPASVGVLEAPAGSSRLSEGRVRQSNGKVDCCHPLGTCDDCPILDDCSEAELVEACRKGFRQAQRLVYETHHQRIVALMMRMTGDHDEAFDLSQQAFVRVFDRIGDFRGESALGTWIHRVAVNEALQHLRRKKRYQRITETIAEDPKRTAPITEDPARSIDLRTALGRLPERMRKMVHLRYEEGLDYAGIARALGVKQGTVASGLNRARRQLRYILQ